MRLLQILLVSSLALASSSVMAGNIVWRSPIAGVLVSAAAPSDPPPVSSLGVLYRATTTGAGSAFSISPDGARAGDIFAALDALPPGLVLDPSTGRIVGVALQSSVISIRVNRAGVYETVTLSITVA